MNIIVKPHGNDLCYCRPDTTWERENKDFYVPEGICGIHWAPVLFVRISKAGKCIGKKFASRYYDSFGYGALMYCVADGNTNVAFTSCADHTSLLPAPSHSMEELDNEANVFEVKKNDEFLFGFPKINYARMVPSGGELLKEMIEDAICNASKLTSLRIGDYMAVELTPLCPLAGREEGEASFKATFCGNVLYDIKLIF